MNTFQPYKLSHATDILYDSVILLFTSSCMPSGQSKVLAESSMKLEWLKMFKLIAKYVYITYIKLIYDYTSIHKGFRSIAKTKSPMKVP